MVIISPQIKRDLEMSEYFSLLEAFPTDLLCAAEGGCAIASGTEHCTRHLLGAAKINQYGLGLGYI